MGNLRKRENIILIKFESKRSASFVMQASIAEQLIAMMGQQGRLEHSISGVAVEEALRCLERALAKQTTTKVVFDDDEDEREQVSLDARAQPLKEMLMHAKRKDYYVMWHPE